VSKVPAAGKKQASGSGSALENASDEKPRSRSPSANSAVSSSDGISSSLLEPWREKQHVAPLTLETFTRLQGTNLPVEGAVLPPAWHTLESVLALQSGVRDRLYNIKRDQRNALNFVPERDLVRNAEPAALPGGKAPVQPIAKKARAVVELEKKEKQQDQVDEEDDSSTFESPPWTLQNVSVLQNAREVEVSASASAYLEIPKNGCIVNLIRLTEDIVQRRSCADVFTMLIDGSLLKSYDARNPPYGLSLSFVVMAPEFSQQFLAFLATHQSTDDVCVLSDVAAEACFTDLFQATSGEGQHSQLVVVYSVNTFRCLEKHNVEVIAPLICWRPWPSNARELQHVQEHLCDALEEETKPCSNCNKKFTVVLEKSLNEKVNKCIPCRAFAEHGLNQVEQSRKSGAPMSRELCDKVHQTTTMLEDLYRQQSQRYEPLRKQVQESYLLDVSRSVKELALARVILTGLTTTLPILVMDSKGPLFTSSLCCWSMDATQKSLVLTKIIQSHLSSDLQDYDKFFSGAPGLTRYETRGADFWYTHVGLLHVIEWVLYAVSLANSTDLGPNNQLADVAFVFSNCGMLPVAPEAAEFEATLGKTFQILMNLEFLSLGCWGAGIRSVSLHLPSENFENDNFAELEFGRSSDELPLFVVKGIDSVKKAKRGRNEDVEIVDVDNPHDNGGEPIQGAAADNIVLLDDNNDVQQGQPKKQQTEGPANNNGGDDLDHEPMDESD